MKFIMVPKTYDTAVNFLYKVFFAFLRCKNDFTKALSACEWVIAGFYLVFLLGSSMCSFSIMCTRELNNIKEMQKKFKKIGHILKDGDREKSAQLLTLRRHDYRPFILGIKPCESPP